VKRTIAATAITLLLSANAWAQIDEDDSSGYGGEEGTAPVTDEPAPPPAPLPSPAPAEPTAEPAAGTSDSSEGGESNLPSRNGIAIGAGYVLPADIDRINTASVRFRIGAITLEPRVAIAMDRQSNDAGGVETEDSGFDFLLETTARIPLASAGDLEFVVLGGAGLGYSSDNPEGNDNDSKATTISLLWGIGIDYWLTERWTLSLTASNPLLQVTSTSQDQFGGTSADATSVSAGAIFSPTIAAMVHLYFF